jgi:hypothetical protein
VLGTGLGRGFGSFSVGATGSFSSCIWTEQIASAQAPYSADHEDSLKGVQCIDSHPASFERANVGPFRGKDYQPTALFRLKKTPQPPENASCVAMRSGKQLRDGIELVVDAKRQKKRSLAF